MYMGIGDRWDKLWWIKRETNAGKQWESNRSLDQESETERQAKAEKGLKRLKETTTEAHGLLSPHFFMVAGVVVLGPQLPAAQLLSYDLRPTLRHK